jgi:hypothetical protein
VNAIHQYWAYREQAAYLRSPERRSGPSKEEAEEEAQRLESKANDIAEALFYGGNALHARLETWIQYNSGVCDPADIQALDNWNNVASNQ